jgi:hypothetical protein
VARAYSKRLLVLIQQQQAAYTVPAGKTAVVKMVSAWNNGVSATTLRINLAGSGLWQTTVPGGDGSFASSLMIVANAGEELRLVSGSSAMNAAMFGYLLDNSG